jgi:elongation factor 1-gamma
LTVAELVGIQLETPDFNPGLFKNKEFLAKSPLKKIPLLDGPEGSLTESNAIIRYLARIANSRLAGTTPLESARIDMWLDSISEDLEVPVCTVIYPILGLSE